MLSKVEMNFFVQYLHFCAFINIFEASIYVAFLLKGLKGFSDIPS